MDLLSRILDAARSNIFLAMILVFSPFIFIFLLPMFCRIKSRLTHSPVNDSSSFIDRLTFLSGLVNIICWLFSAIFFPEVSFPSDIPGFIAYPIVIVLGYFVGLAPAFTIFEIALDRRYKSSRFSRMINRCHRVAFLLFPSFGISGFVSRIWVRVLLICVFLFYFISHSIESEKYYRDHPLK